VWHYSAAAPGVYFLADTWFKLFVPTFCFQFDPPFLICFQLDPTFFHKKIVKQSAIFFSFPIFQSILLRNCAKINLLI